RFNCEKELRLAVIGGKWKMVILWDLGKEGRKGLNELKRLIGDIREKMVVNQLREVEEDMIVEREVYRVVLVKVEYCVIGEGERLM
ncbi:winged helix-turn-helix transcriptional regulator, partial [Bacillus subtilis]|uniref:winged helix-turn-helix transcriptional regulator n=1 Tax=Bacillus subtilis TaxID=1423 RepID=UPI00119EF645